MKKVLDIMQAPRLPKLRQVVLADPQVTALRALVTQALELAAAGDKDMLKFILSKTLPAPKAPPVYIDVEGCATLDEYARRVVDAACRGEISPAEAFALTNTVKNAIGIADFEDSRALRVGDKDKPEDDSLF
jgi:hypothetical protein